jgi:hypothetical protein
MPILGTFGNSDESSERSGDMRRDLISPSIGCGDVSATQCFRATRQDCGIPITTEFGHWRPDDLLLRRITCV